LTEFLKYLPDLFTAGDYELKDDILGIWSAFSEKDGTILKTISKFIPFDIIAELLGGQFALSAFKILGNFAAETDELPDICSRKHACDSMQKILNTQTPEEILKEMFWVLHNFTDTKGGNIKILLESNVLKAICDFIIDKNTAVGLAKECFPCLDNVINNAEEFEVKLILENCFLTGALAVLLEVDDPQLQYQIVSDMQLICVHTDDNSRNLADFDSYGGMFKLLALTDHSNQKLSGIVNAFIENYCSGYENDEEMIKESYMKT
jgi:hypothetical protein